MNNLTKICSKCHIEKEIINFYRDKSHKDGFSSACKECIKNNKNRKEYIKKYNLEHKSQKKEYKKQYDIKNKLYKKEQNKQYYKEKKHYILNRNKKYALNHKEDWKKYMKKWRNKNKEILKIKFKQKKETDINFKISSNLRSRLNIALKREYKSGSAVRDLGCSIVELKQYLESKFQPGMTWKNYGRNGWHIDHLISLSHFDLTNREQLLEAVHYTNLQPMWEHENCSKKNKIS